MLARGVEIMMSKNKTASSPRTEALLTPPPSNESSAAPSPSDERPPDEGFDRAFGPNEYCFFPGVPQDAGLDGIRIKERKRDANLLTPSSMASAETPESDHPRSVIHHGGVDDSQHYGAITKKFWGKAAPNVPVEDYLFRYVVNPD